MTAENHERVTSRRKNDPVYRNNQSITENHLMEISFGINDPSQIKNSFQKRDHTT